MSSSSILQRVENVHAFGCFALRWSPSGKIWSGGGDGSVYRWDHEFVLGVDTNLPDYDYTISPLAISSLTSDKDEKYMIASCIDGYAYVIDVNTNPSLNTKLGCPEEESPASSIHPLGDSVVKCCLDGSMRLYNISSGIRSCRYSMKEESSDGSMILSCCFSPNGRYVVSGHLSGRICVYDVESQSQLHTFEYHSGPVRSIVFDPTSSFFVSVSDDKTAVGVNIKHGELLNSFSGHSGWVLSTDLSCDGYHFSTGSSDRSVRMWDFRANDSICSFSSHSDSVWSISYDPSGKEVLSGSSDGCLIRYSTAPDLAWDLSSSES